LLPLLVVPFWAKKSQKVITSFGLQRVTRRELHSRFMHLLALVVYILSQAHGLLGSCYKMRRHASKQIRSSQSTKHPPTTLCKAGKKEDIYTEVKFASITSY
jgi:hypothetical protein